MPELATELIAVPSTALFHFFSLPMNYYNEHDPKAAAWLRELIACGHIPAGVVDERDIQQVKNDELTSYTQCHFFAGIGGWSLALRLAGWPDNLPVWTGSCPCQPFSSAGKQKAENDERHLWPDFRRLIEAGRPAIAFGEQVASKAGREWLAGIRTDLEALAYEVGAADLCAAGVNAPHIRQRIFWVADSNCAGRTWSRQAQSTKWHGDTQPVGTGQACGMADNQSERRNGSTGMQWQDGRALTETSGRLVHSCVSGLEGHSRNGNDRNQPGRIDAEPSGSTSQASRPWNQYELLECTDGNARRIEPGTFPLAHGIPGRVGLLRVYGNAIVPQLAAEFVMAWQDLHIANGQEHL